jgi:uncharacterized protein (TIGR02246 family)
MPSRIFPTPQDCEAAFYDALEKSDLEAMMAVWAEDEDVLCIHPGGARVAGHAAIREVWRQMFAGGERLSVVVGQVMATQAMLMATHSVHEFISMKGEPRPAHPVVATNVYIRSGNGWRMIVHHASPTTQKSVQPAASAPPQRPKTLH